MRRIVMLAALLAVAAPAASPARSAATDTDSHPVEDSAQDLGHAELLRSPDGRLVLRVRFAGAPAVEHLRVLLDVAEGRGEPQSGADFLLEGFRFYRYPDGAQGWTWDEIAPPIAMMDGSSVTFILPALEGIGTGGWYAETVGRDWLTVDRLPNAGFIELDASTLPVFAPPSRLEPEPTGDLLDHSVRTLSFRLDTEIRAARWKKLSDPREQASPSWRAPFRPHPVPLRFALTDAATGETGEALPQEMFSSSNALRWTGSTLGVDWNLVLEPDEGDALRLTGLLKASTDRCVRVEIGCALALDGWVWHDDVVSRRPVRAEDDVARNTTASPFGVDGQRSVYPFGVVSSGEWAMVAETDPAEPRVFQVVADGANGFFGVRYDMALTLQTSNFPGAASFRCALRAVEAGDDAFREALKAFHERHPARREPAPEQFGAWRLCERGLRVPGAEDFGVAYAIGDAGCADEGAGLPVLARIEPWRYDVPMPAGLPRTADEAIRTARLLALGRGRPAEQAASALLGVTRDADGSCRVSFEGTGTSAGAAMLINTDPDAAPSEDSPLTPAMAAWREANRALAVEGVAGILLDGMPEADGPDYNPAATGLADHPCTFEQGVWRPCLANESSAHELTVALAGALRSRGKCVAGAGAGLVSPFMAPLVDLMGERVTWDGGGASGAGRALAGRRPYVTLLETDFEKRTGEEVRQYVEDCLFHGFLAGFGASYWWKPSFRERDRGLFRTYLPLARRLAEAGWEPVPEVTVSAKDVRIEQFGAATAGVFHVTLRNPTDAPCRATLGLPGAAEEVFVFQPLSATPGLTVALPPGGVGVVDVVRAEALENELAFLRGWAGAEAEPCRRTLESVVAERGKGVACGITHPVPAVRGEANAVVVEVVNHGDAPVSFSGLKIVSPGQFRPFDEERAVVRPGSSYLARAYFLEEDAVGGAWLEVQWRVEAGGGDLTCTRMIRPAFVDAVRVTSSQERMTAARLEGAIELGLRNFSTNRQVVRVVWEGDFRGGGRKEVLDPGAARVVSLPVTARKPVKGQMNARVMLGGESIFAKWFDADFTSAKRGE